MQQESLIEHKFCKFTEVYLLEIIFLYLTFIIGKKISPIFMSFCFSNEEKKICSSSMSRQKRGGGRPRNSMYWYKVQFKYTSPGPCC